MGPWTCRPVHGFFFGRLGAWPGLLGPQCMASFLYAQHDIIFFL